MPWKHCEIPFILDDEPCPTCGISKEAWTVNIDQTRVLQVARQRAAVELELVDLEGNPVPDAPYEATLASGARRKGTLGPDGLTSVRNLVPGQVRVEFPEHRTGGQFELTAEFIKAKQQVKHTYVAGHWIEITLLDPDGEPVPGEPFRVEFPDEDELEPREGTLDDVGFAVVGGLPKAGPCTVVFPKRFLPQGAEAQREEDA